MSQETAIGSPWHGDPGTGRPALEREIEVDVAVVGAGIVGLTTALLLQRRGATVAVLEAREVAAAASGNNTAKVSSLQGLAYSTLVARDLEAATDYARANERGIALISELAEELAIDCSLRRSSNHTFAETPEDRDEIEREVEAARAAGLDAYFVDSTPLPFEACAVRLDEQVELDPVAYLRGLADAIDGPEEPAVFEQARVRSIDGGSVRTEDGSVRADRVVLATHLPIVDHVGLFARAEPQASFAVTARVPGPALEGMFIDAAGKHSMRALKSGDGYLLIVAGQGRRLGTGDAGDSIEALKEYARARFGAGGFVHRWDAHDFVTEDRLPFVGPVGFRSERTLTATGMNKWGLALGTACAEMLAASIADGGRGWPDSFDTRRLPRPGSLATLARHGAETAVHLVGDRLKRASASELGRDEAAIVGAGVGQRAAYRDRDGRLHELSARCTHLGCIVAFNRATRTWDCPCHGSRFALDGSVLEGPAVSPLAPKPSSDGG